MIQKTSEEQTIKTVAKPHAQKTNTYKKNIEAKANKTKNINTRVIALGRSVAQQQGGEG